MNKSPDAQRMEKIVSLCKRRGFIFQSSEIYGGLNGCWEYGPLGVELKRNVKNYWWRVMVHEPDDGIGMDGSILTHPEVLKASGHVEGFSDPMIDCRTCKARLRADQVIEKKRVRQCPNCGGKDLTEARPFNLMFQTQMGAAADETSIAYLRPETAQSIFVQFKNILEVSRKKLPFGIAQIGKAFRNEINPRNFTFRSREFEQMELEYFDEETKQRFVPHVVEPSAGVDRTVLALICEAYSIDEAPDEKGKMETRLVLRFHPRMAPIKCGIFPLLKNNDQLVAKAKKIVGLLRADMNVFYDESGAIGRRYRRQDEIGTPFGITVDFETLGEKNDALTDTVTLRERDSMKQERVKINDLADMLISRVS